MDLELCTSDQLIEELINRSTFAGIIIKSVEEIKNECEQMYQQIKLAKERLKELRDICKHEKTFEGNYSYRVGSIQLANICEYCGSVVNLNNTF